MASFQENTMFMDDESNLYDSSDGSVKPLSPISRLAYHSDLLAIIYCEFDTHLGPNMVFQVSL